MDAQHWQRLSPLLDALLELDAPTRARSLALTREEDPALADELEALLALEADNDEFLDTPLVDAVGGPRAGSEIGPYQLQRMLGEGGMGQVWLASRADGLYQKRVALKLLRPGLADPGLRLRFTRERQILARLEHPHIARLLDAGISADGQPYLALEYVEGEAITEWCRARDASLDLRLQLFLQVCAAVRHAHANLIVHRDLKPSNVLVTALDEVRLLDFGIAKLLDVGTEPVEHTRTEHRAFTLHYAAPEQILGEPISTMTDVYSLGVILYELLTGGKPYRPKRNSDAQWEESVLHQDPTRPSQAIQRGVDATQPRESAQRQRRDARRVAGDLDNIVLKAMAKLPEHRYPSVEALALDLQRYRDGKPVHARAQNLRYRLGKFVARQRWLLATVLFAVVVLGSALAVVGWQAREAVREATRAQAMQEFMLGLFEDVGGSGDPQRAAALSSLLSAATERGEHALAVDPLAQAELLAVIARLHLGIGDVQHADAVLERQRRLLPGLANAPAALGVGASIQRARVAQLQDDRARCMAMLQATALQAQALINSQPQLLAEHRLQSGLCGSGQQARADLQQALSLRRAVSGEGPGTVEVMMALADLDSADPPTALAGYRQAADQLRALGAGSHPLQVDLDYRIARTLQASGQVAEAQAARARAVALAERLYGPRHPMRERLDALGAELDAAAATAH